MIITNDLEEKCPYCGAEVLHDDYSISVDYQFGAGSFEVDYCCDKCDEDFKVCYEAEINYTYIYTKYNEGLPTKKLFNVNLENQLVLVED